MEWIDNITPFGYLGFEIFEPGYSIAWGAVVFFVLVGVLLLVLAYKKFDTLDIGA